MILHVTKILLWGLKAVSLSTMSYKYTAD